MDVLGSQTRMPCEPALAGDRTALRGRVHACHARVPALSSRVALGLGANAGEPRHTLQLALCLLHAGGLRWRAVAPCYLTRPVDCVAGSPSFVNTVLVGLWRGSPRALLALCQATEHALGRPARHSSRAPRTLDIDLLLFGSRRLETPWLVVPHPRLCRRRFALQPLADLAPRWRLPGTGLTVAEALAALPPAAPGDCEVLPAGYITDSL